MATKQYRAITPGFRGRQVLVRKITKSEPEKHLTIKLKQGSGRGNTGRITVRHRCAGNKRLYRLIDFKRDKLGKAIVKAIEYDPYRSANIW